MIYRLLVTVALVASIQAGAVQAASAHWNPAKMRAAIYRTDPCLAHIVDHEDGSWNPLRYGAGGSYGLPQASPPSKMASAGADWRTNGWTQLRWMRGYVNGRYGGSCQAWSFWQAHYWY